MPDRLYRSRDERVIGGVAGGIAESLGVDPTIIRIAWVILAFGIPVTPLIYLVLLFVIPEAPVEAPEPSAATGTGAGAAASAGGEQGAGAVPPPWWSARDSRRAARDARRAARRARSDDGGRSGALLLGLVLIAVGGWFLVRQYLPTIGLDLSWPFVAVGLGLVLILVSLRRGGPSAD